LQELDPATRVTKPNDDIHFNAWPPFGTVARHHLDERSARLPSLLTDIAGPGLPTIEDPCEFRMKISRDASSSDGANTKHSNERLAIGR